MLIISPADPPSAPVHCSDIKYLDCRGFYDLAAEAIALVLACLICRTVLTHYINLSRESESGNNSEYQKSVRRKKWINFIQIVYLCTLITCQLCSIALFLVYLFDLQYILGHRLGPIYKITEVLFINGLNALNVTMGLLYWKAMRGYYVLSDIHIPFLARRFVKLVFMVLYGSCMNAVIICFIWAFTDYVTEN